MRPLIHLLLASLVAGCANRSYTEAEFKRPAHAECIAGDCRNGTGTLRYLDGIEVTGARVNGEQTAGTYQIRWPCQPDRTHALTYDAQKRPVSGTIIRTCIKDSLAMSQAPRVASFSGTFFAVNNPFTRETVSSYKSGTYTDTRGIVWEGEFDYIPIRDSVELPGYGKTFLRSGAFVFVGARIDTELDEVVRGLFISEPTRPEADIRLIRARPDYLESLRSTFVADRAANAAELAEEQRASREAFNTVLNVVAGAAIVYGSARAMAAADRATLDSMTGLIRGGPPERPGARAERRRWPARLPGPAQGADRPVGQHGHGQEERRRLVPQVDQVHPRRVHRQQERLHRHGAVRLRTGEELGVQHHAGCLRGGVLLQVRLHLAPERPGHHQPLAIGRRRTRRRAAAGCGHRW